MLQLTWIWGYHLHSNEVRVPLAQLDGTQIIINKHTGTCPQLFANRDVLIILSCRNWNFFCKQPSQNFNYLLLDGNTCTSECIWPRTDPNHYQIKWFHGFTKWLLAHQRRHHNKWQTICHSEYVQYLFP